jgi:peptidoglycan/LPS O-acetylase OafA/YrhL
VTNHKHPHLAHPKYRPDIDGLRAMAVLGVVIFHAFPVKMPGGFIGVDIFFVISGFLISTITFSSLERDRFSLVEFYVRRVLRIFPALILVLISCLVFGWFVLMTDEYKQLGKHTAAGAGFIQNFILWRESGYFDDSVETKPLLHLWSLAIEEQFYIFWPLLLAFVWKRHWSFLTITAVIATVSFATNIYLIMNGNPTASFYLPFSRFWELMVGGALAYVVLHRPQLIEKHKDAQSFIGFALILAGLLLLNKIRDFPGWWALLPTLGAFFIISAGPSSWLNEKLLTNKLMVWIGLISYPLYLWHWPLLAYVKITQESPSDFQLLGVVFLATTLSFFTYKYVEKPLRINGRQGQRTLFLLLIIFTIGAFGATIYQSNGRVGEPFHKVEYPVIKYDFAKGYRLDECFLQGTKGDKYSQACDGDHLSSKPTVVLWGDSHSAALYRGIKKHEQSHEFNLAQYNSGGCPPVINFDVDNRKDCRALNDYVFEKIKTNKVDTVILAAYWLMYDGKHDEFGKPWNYLSEEKLASTIQLLKAAGVKNITLIGQLPTYRYSQLAIGAYKFEKGLNNRTNYALIQESELADKKMRHFAKNNNLGFVSPFDILCNNSGCLISTSLDNFIPLAWDYGHLTTVGSEYLIDLALSNNLIQLPAR